MTLPSLDPTTPNGDGDAADEFRRFDVVSDDSDHCFLSTGGGKKTKAIDRGAFLNASSGVHKKIMQEWRILERNLPDSIFVRVYEKRIDLLTAAIVGAAGTPYHDGLFFFDVAFPPNYPTQPPMVHYRSFGLRINPNLYENGRVCLSLINTWSGKRSEKWNPKESSVLQILVSLQALVLNQKPYFNEPGNGLWGLEKSSYSYNEDVFMLSCRTMMFLIKRPPKNFQRLVVGHFNERAALILSACRAYHNGRARIGFYSNLCNISGSITIAVSCKFKKMMEKVYPELVSALASTGAPVRHFVEQLESERKTKRVIVRKKRGVASTIFKTVKKLLGLKRGNRASKPKTS